MKNFFIKFLVNLYQSLFRANPKQTEAPRFLVVSTTGLGDTLWATPGLKALKCSFPKSYVALLTSSIGEEILKDNPYIDEIFVIKSSSLFSLLPLFRALRKRKIESALIFHVSQRPILPFCLLL